MESWEKGNESSYEVLLHGKLTFLMGLKVALTHTVLKHSLQATLTKTPTFITLLVMLFGPYMCSAVKND